MMMDVCSGDGNNNGDNDEGSNSNKRSYHVMRDQYRFHHILPEMIIRLSKYLEPKDAVALGATSRHLRTILSLSRLRPRTLISMQRYTFMNKKEEEGGGGGEEEKIKKPRQAFEIPSYKKANISIHTLKISFCWRVGIVFDTIQLGPPQRHEAKIWIVGRRSSSTATATTANDNDNNVMFPGVGSTRIVEESPPLINTGIAGMFLAQENQKLSISFVPLDGEVYELWYRVSSSETGPVHMHLNQIKTEYLIFDNEEMLFGTNYETLLKNGILNEWDIDWGGVKREDRLAATVSESFVANLLLSTCKSLRMKILLKKETTNNNEEEEDNEPVIDDIMASFFDQFNIMKTPASLQVVEDIVQADIDEKRVHQRIVVKAQQNEKPQRQEQAQQHNHGGGGIAIGGGIRIQIDHQNGAQVHQIHLGPDGQPVVQAGGDGNNNNGHQQPQVFVHRMGGNGGEGMAGFPPGLFAAAGGGGEGMAGFPPGLFAAAGGGGEGMAGGLPGIFAAAGGGGEGMAGLPGIFAAAAAAAAAAAHGGNNGNNGGGGEQPQQQQQDGVNVNVNVDAGAAEQQQDENVNDQWNNIPGLRAGGNQNGNDDDPTNNDNINQGDGQAVHVETVNMDLDDDDDAVDDNENPDGNGGGGRRPPPAQPQQQQHRNGQDQNGGYYGMLHDFLGIDQPPEGANDAAQQQQNRGGAAAAAEPPLAPPPPPQNLPNQIPQQLQDALNQMQGQVPGLIGNIMNMVDQQQHHQPPHPGMPPVAMGLEMFQQMMGGGMQGGPFGFPNNNPNNNNFNDDDIPDIPEID